MSKLKWPGISFLLAALLVVPALPVSAKGGNKHLCLPAKHKTCTVVSYDSASRELTFTTHTSTATVGQTSTATTPQTGTATLPVSEDVVVKLSHGKGPKHRLERGKPEWAGKGKPDKHDKDKGKHDKPEKDKNGGDKSNGKHSEGRNPTRGSTDDLQPGATILKLKVRDGVIEKIRLRVARSDDDHGEHEGDGQDPEEVVEEEDDGN
ncbi:MAG: hypothetical protein ACRDKZ_00030 [Actinomycetota bacterium]